MKRLMTLMMVMVVMVVSVGTVEARWGSHPTLQNPQGYGYGGYGGYGGGYYGDSDAGKMLAVGQFARDLAFAATSLWSTQKSWELAGRQQEYQNQRRTQPAQVVYLTPPVYQTEPQTVRIIKNDARTQNSSREKIRENEARIQRLEKNQQEQQKAQQQMFSLLRLKKAELLKKLKEENKAERKKAISGLAGFSYDDKVRKALEEILLSDPDPELRKEVAESLGRMKNRKVLPALKEARVEDENKDVRRAADEAIRKIS